MLPQMGPPETTVWEFPRGDDSWRIEMETFFEDIGDFAEMTRVYKTMFPEPRPARTTVQVAGLVHNARVEISAIAVKQR